MVTNTRTWARGTVLGLLILLLLSGCAGKKEKGLKTIQGEPETLYKQGLIQFNKRQYPEARKKFEELKSNFPDSPPYTVLAELKIADCHFFSKEYVEAAAAYEEFRKIHPTHEEIPYVQFQIGMSYFSQILSADRDPTSAQKALSHFEYLTANYPPSLFTEKAKEKIRICRKRLADHEFYIGDFYYRQEKFQAAISRFEILLEKFPRMPDEDKTLFLLGKSYYELNQQEKARDVLNKLVNEYPKSPHAKEARAILRGTPLKKVSTRKLKKEKRKEVQTTETGEVVVLVKYDEEGRKAAFLTAEEKVEGKKGEERVPIFSVTDEAVNPALPKDDFKKREPEVPSKQTGAEGTKTVAPSGKGEGKPDEALEVVLLPSGEPPKPVSPKDEPALEKKPEEKKEKTALSSPLTPFKGKEMPKKREASAPTQEAKPYDMAHPIDITSNRVETYSKENLIVFKGDVTARQKDMVIYADSLEAVIIEDGKGIEKVIAGGNVKVQQGTRVANSQKAVFYNLEKKVVLTGEPKLWEGENIVSGDEIIFYIEQNRIEVKGGPGIRGKAKIHPRGESEKKE